MKRTILAVALAVLAIPAFADQASEKAQAARGLPFEQTQLDRGFLADVADGASSPSSGGTAPTRDKSYWRPGDDRVPLNTIPHDHAVKSDPVWSKDPHFIAPPL